MYSIIVAVHLLVGKGGEERNVAAEVHERRRAKPEEERFAPVFGAPVVAARVACRNVEPVMGGGRGCQEGM